MSLFRRIVGTAWVDRELADHQLKDECLGKRFRLRFAQLSSSPGDSIPLVCQDWANMKAAYRFFDNDRVNEAQILQGYFQATRSVPLRRWVQSLCCTTRRGSTTSARISMRWARPASTLPARIKTARRVTSRHARS